MDAEEYITKQALGQLQGMRDRKYGIFFPFGGIRIFSQYNSFQEEINLLKQIILDKGDSDNHEIGRTLDAVIHESFHFHHILSSPLGFIINYCCEIQAENIGTIILKEIGTNFSYDQFKSNKSYFKYVNPDLRSYNNLQYFRVLFGDQHFLQNDLTVINFAMPFFEYLIFLNDDLFRITNEKINVSKIDRLMSDVVSVGNNYIEKIPFIQDWRNDSKDKHLSQNRELSSLYNYSGKSNSVYISTINIIESYARICQFFWTYDILVSPYSGFKHDANYYPKIELEENNLIAKKLLSYFRKEDKFAIDFVRYKLRFDENDLKTEFFLLKICAFIFELSLCVPITPFTLSRIQIKPEELIIIVRLARIVDHINKHFDFYVDDFSNAGTNKEKKRPIEILNKLTKNLGWVTYSDCVNDLLKTYSKGFIAKNDYLVDVSKKMIRSKLTSMFNPTSLDFGTVHESQFLMFDDVFFASARKTFDSINSTKTNIEEIILNDPYSKYFNQNVFNDIFMKHFVFADSFKDASKRIKEILPETFLFEKYMYSLLNDSCFNKILTVQDIL